jgi:hypothetical protein
MLLYLPCIIYAQDNVLLLYTMNLIGYIKYVENEEHGAEWLLSPWYEPSPHPSTVAIVSLDDAGNLSLESVRSVAVRARARPQGSMQVGWNPAGLRDE